MSAWTRRHLDGKAVRKIVPPCLRIPCWKGPGADSEEKHEPASDIDTAVVDSLKACDAGNIFALLQLELLGSRFVDAYHRAVLGFVR